MRKLIRSKTTRAFLTREGNWTNNFQKAWHFPDVSAALALNGQVSASEVELYYSFNPDRASRWDFALAGGS